MLAGIRSGFFRREILDSAIRYQQDVESKQRFVVGVNAFVDPEDEPIETHKGGPQTEQDQQDHPAVLPDYYGMSGPALFTEALAAAGIKPV